MSHPSDRFEEALERSGRFFMGNSPLQLAAEEIARRLTELGVEYAVVGALALYAHGYERFTTDVDLLLTREGLASFKAAHLGRGYLEIFPGSKGVRDTANDVKIDFLLAGEYPGDGRPKSVSFPHPKDACVESGRYRIITREKLVELKLASGMSSANRLKDLADVQELIKATKPPRDLGDKLDASVREKYFELWDAVAAAGPEDY